MEKASNEGKRRAAQGTAIMMMALATIAIAACSDSTKPGSGTNQVAFSTKSGTAAASMAMAPITSKGHTLDLTDVRLTVARIELMPSATDTCPDNDNDAARDSANKEVEHCAPFKAGPIFVDLPLDTSAVSLPANTVPPGTYTKVEIRVTQVELKGTFDSTAFDVPVPLNARLHVKFTTPIVATQGKPTVVTVNIPVNTWLVNPDSSLVNPNTISTSPMVLGQVVRRILSSINAFEDRDRERSGDHDD